MQQLLAAGGYASTDGIDLASRNGHLAIVELLHRAGMPATCMAIDLAAVNGHERVVAFLREHRSEGFTQRALQAAKGNQRMIDILNRKY